MLYCIHLTVANSERKPSSSYFSKLVLQDSAFQAVGFFPAVVSTTSWTFPKSTLMTVFLSWFSVTCTLYTVCILLYVYG